MTLFLGAPDGTDLGDHENVADIKYPDPEATYSFEDGSEPLVALTEEWACRIFPHVSDRFAQRQLLDVEGITQPTYALFPGKHVAKRKYSTMNSGVLLPHHDQSLGPGYGTLVEEYIPGTQFEINAIADWEGTVHFPWPALMQRWNGTETAILGYQVRQLHNGIALQSTLQAAVQALGLVGCGLNMEFRLWDGKLYVIEVHARLGEDDKNDYYATWSPNQCPFETLMEYLE